MMMIKGRHKATMIAVLILGIVSFLCGLLLYLLAEPEGHDISRVLGMITGFGFGIIVVAVVMLIRSKVLSKEKLEQEEVDLNDERNIMIRRTAGSIGWYASIAVLVILAFVFAGTGYPVPSVICIGGLYVTMISVGIAVRVLEKR